MEFSRGIFPKLNVLDGTPNSIGTGEILFNLSESVVKCHILGLKMWKTKLLPKLFIHILHGRVRRYYCNTQK